ncbi:hypothetical protein F5888DRAFT_1642457 [Russula emetica]|nr:hypothetical protein F5888DRAFT_1642457 [Russula emetica]
MAPYVACTVVLGFDGDGDNSGNSKGADSGNNDGNMRKMGVREALAKGNDNDGKDGQDEGEARARGEGQEVMFSSNLAPCMSCQTCLPKYYPEPTVVRYKAGTGPEVDCRIAEHHTEALQWNPMGSGERRVLSRGLPFGTSDSLTCPVSVPTHDSACCPLGLGPTYSGIGRSGGQGDLVMGTGHASSVRFGPTILGASPTLLVTDLAPIRLSLGPTFLSVVEPLSRTLPFCTRITGPGDLIAAGQD